MTKSDKFGGFDIGFESNFGTSVRNPVKLMSFGIGFETALRQICPKFSYNVNETIPVVELAEEPRLGDGVRAVPHLAPAARHVAKVVVPLRQKDS